MASDSFCVVYSVLIRIIFCCVSCQTEWDYIVIAQVILIIAIVACFGWTTRGEIDVGASRSDVQLLFFTAMGNLTHAEHEKCVFFFVQSHGMANGNIILNIRCKNNI